MKTPFSAFCLLTSALFFTGCTLIETRPDPSRFYVLDAPAVAKPRTVWPFALAVARLQTPSYLDQPQLVSRAGGSRVTFSEFNRWLEPVDKGATRVFADALASRLGADRLALEPALDIYPDGVLVQAQLQRLDGELGGDVVLRARYRVASVNDGRTLVTGDVDLSEPCSGDDYQAYAAALGRVLDKFAGEVAGKMVVIKKGPDGMPAN